MGERRYAILIGNSQFPAEPKLQALRAPENDVDGLNEVFTSKELGDFTEVSVLKNESSYVVQLKINDVLEQAHKGDFVVIYYSGHGKLDPAGRLHLATKDTKISALQATSIPIARVRDFVDTSQCSKVALILDCCYSGAAGKAFARGDFDEQLQLVSAGRGTYVMTASTAIQIAQEMEADQNGLFTKHIIEGIRTGEADLDQDGVVLMDELYRYVHKRMLDEGFQQPMRWNLDVRGDIVIARTGKSPGEARRKAIRDHINRLANEGALPNAIVIKAWAVVHETRSEASSSSGRYLELLDQLVVGRLRTGDFIEEWYKVQPPRPISDEDAAVQREAAERPARLRQEEKRRQEDLRLKQQRGGQEVTTPQSSASEPDGIARWVVIASGVIALAAVLLFGLLAQR